MEIGTFCKILLEILSTSGYDSVLSNSIRPENLSSLAQMFLLGYAAHPKPQITEHLLAQLAPCQRNILGLKTSPGEQNQWSKSHFYTAGIQGEQFLLEEYMTGRFCEYILPYEKKTYKHKQRYQSAVWAMHRIQSLNKLRRRASHKRITSQKRVWKDYC